MEIAPTLSRQLLAVFETLPDTNRVELMDFAQYLANKYGQESVRRG